MQSNNVNKGIFHFLITRIWAPMSVCCYENSSGYFTENICVKLHEKMLNGSQEIEEHKKHINEQKCPKMLCACDCQSNELKVHGKFKKKYRVILKKQWNTHKQTNRQRD